MNQDKLKELKNVLEIINTDRASKQEVAQFAVQIIQAVKATQAQLKSEMDMSMKGCEDMCSTFETTLKDTETRLTALISSSTKTTQDKAYKELSNAIYKLEQSIKDVPQFNSSALEAQWAAVVKDLDNKIAQIKPFVITAIEIRDYLETLEGDERLDASAIKGLKTFTPKIADEIVNRAISIVDNRTSFLINRLNTLVAQVDAINLVVSTAYEIPTGTVNGINKVFTFTKEKFVLLVDGVVLNKNSSDGTPNWTGTTTITLAIAPTINIFSIA